MCLLIIGINAHPDYSLIIAANRDEFYNRPKLPAHYWYDAPFLLAGKDLKAGGTWMGITKQGKFAALTNYRDIPSIKENAPSRGHIVSDFLFNKNPANDYIEKISSLGNLYNGYNLILGDFFHLFYYSNVNNSRTFLNNGVYGLSNHLLDTDWFKVRESKKNFNEILSRKNIEVEKLFNLLTDENKAVDNDLPETGLGKEFEKILSSAFIKSPVYGTRCSTVIMVDKNKNVTFIERSYENSPESFNENIFNFQID